MKNMVLMLFVLLTVGCAFNNSENIYFDYKNLIEVRKVDNFEGINSSGAMDIYLKQGDVCSLRLEGDSYIIDNTTTKLENGVLNIKINLNRYISIKPIKAYVTMKDIKSISMKGSGDLIMQTDIKADEFKLSSVGSGDCRLKNIEANNSSLSISGSGDLFADSFLSNSLVGITKGSGNLKFNHIKVNDLNVKSSGSGDLSVKLFDVQNADLSASGSGDFYLEGIQSQKMNGSFSGSGDKIFSGEIAYLKIVQKGSGDVKATKLKASEADFSISGSGTAVLQVEDKLDIALSGSSSFQCIGSPNIGVMKVGRGANFIND